MAGDLLHRRPGETQLDMVDRLPRDVRRLVHDYGLSVVAAFFQNGITRPSTIRHLVRTVRLGAREPGNRRGDVRPRVLAPLDTWLLNQGAPITARQVVRAIRDTNHTVVPMFEPQVVALDREAWGDL